MKTYSKNQTSFEQGVGWSLWGDDKADFLKIFFYKGVETGNKGSLPAEN